MLSNILSLCLLFLIVLFHLYKKFVTLSKYRHLPGPKGLPWFGPLKELPSLGFWFKFKEWADKYGSLFGTTIMGELHIFVASEDVANELFGKRGSKYSGRPKVPSVHDSQGNLGTAEYMPLMSRNIYHTRQKKLNHMHLVATKNKNYFNYPSIEAKRFIWRMLNDSSDWVSLTEDMTSRTICRLTWGTPDFAAILKEHAWNLLIAISPLGNRSNLTTPLLLMPTFLSPWKKWEAQRRAKEQAWFQQNWAEVRDRIAKGTTGPSFLRNYLEDIKSQPFDEKEAASTLGMLSITGVFTISSPMQRFVRAAILYPEWFRKVQEEVDSVCGLERMPEVEDAPHLPVLRSFIKECFRWRPPIPTGVVHEVEEDDVYDGYFIPKGAKIHPLEWAFSRDPAKYPSPHTFNPARYLDPSFTATYREPLSLYPQIQQSTAYGWGRRLCQGPELTHHELINACGGLAWAFDIRAGAFQNRDGEEEEVDVEKLRTGKVKKENGSLILGLDKDECEFQVPTSRQESLIIVKPAPFKIRCQVRDGGDRAGVIERQYRESCEKDILRAVGSVGVE
ncbi:cytochrome P450 [Mollisia scopiformis]|uniref:Cytochrome P450 n=1 Tax=Mollisia scopiformis TaxID=149040 RepID=A0A194XC10_MOLSC|nr:cytochrome P450 [Mollisia scopiformis]KUJ17700.1 cytochrome P450 [Mollisia scopiformis]